MSLAEEMCNLSGSFVPALSAAYCQDEEGDMEVIAVEDSTQGGDVDEYKREAEMTSDELKSSLVHEAIRSGRADEVKRLLDEGAVVYAADEHGNIPMYFAASRGYTAVVKLLIEHSVKAAPGQTPLHAAAFFGYDDVVRLLLEEGSDVNAVDEHGSTPLHEAGRGGRITSSGVVEQLLKHGAEVNPVNEYGKTPLHALINGCFVVRVCNANAKLLLEYGARVDVADYEGKTPLDYASEGCFDYQRELVELLLRETGGLASTWSWYRYVLACWWK